MPVERRQLRHVRGNTPRKGEGSRLRVRVGIKGQGRD